MEENDKQLPNLRIVDSEVTIELEEGTKLHVGMSPAMTRALVRSCGIVCHDVGDNVMFYRFDDETIENAVLPKLPEVG